MHLAVGGPAEAALAPLRISNLPVDMILHVSKGLDDDEVARLGCTAKVFDDTINSDPGTESRKRPHALIDTALSGYNMKRIPRAYGQLEHARRYVSTKRQFMLVRLIGRRSRAVSNIRFVDLNKAARKALALQLTIIENPAVRTTEIRNRGDGAHLLDRESQGKLVAAFDPVAQAHAFHRAGTAAEKARTRRSRSGLHESSAAFDAELQHELVQKAKSIPYKRYFAEAVQDMASASVHYPPELQRDLVESTFARGDYETFAHLCRYAGAYETSLQDWIVFNRNQRALQAHGKDA